MDKSIDPGTAAIMHARKIIPLLLLATMWGCNKAEEKPAQPPVQPHAAAPASAPQIATEAQKAAETPKAMEAVQPKPSAPAAAEAKPAAPASSAAAADVEKPYQASCMVCHKMGIAGAPRLGDQADWGPRIKQGKDVLYKHTIEGFKGQKGMMPPRGGSTLKDDQLRALVDYMVGQSQ